MLVVAIVSTIVSVAGCYFMLAQMPSPYNVTIDAAKNIYIDKSPVAIWGEKGLDIYKPEKKMIEIGKKSISKPGNVKKTEKKIRPIL